MYHVNRLIKGKGTNVTLKDTAKYPFQKFNVYGNKYQETSEANYNLLILDDQTITKNGLILTIKDGIVTINGESTASTNIDIPIKKKIKTGSHWFNVGIVNGTVTSNVGFLVMNNETKATISIMNGGGAHSFTLEEDTQTFFRIWTGKNNVLSNRQYKILVSENNTDKTWIEAMPEKPSIDYPSEVRACGDNINIFDGEVEDGGYDTSTGEKQDRANSKRNVNFINVEGLNTIIFSNNGTGIAVNILEYDSNYNFLKETNAYSANKAFNLQDNTSYINFFRGATNTDKIKIEKGNTITPYSKHGQGSITIKKSNKNLFDKTKAVQGFLSVDSGKVGTATDMYTSDFIRIDSSKTYYLPKTGSARGKYFDKDKKLLYPSPTASTNYNDYGGNANNPTIIKDIPEEAKYVRYSVKNELLDTFYMVEGEEDTGYIAHESEEYIVPTQQPFYEGDTFVKIGDEWYEKHNYKVHIFDGSEVLTRVTASNSKYRYSFSDYQTVVEKPINSNTKGEILSNCLINATAIENYNLIESICVTTTGNILIYLDEFSDDADATNILALLKELHDAGTPMYIVFKLAEPTLIECTQEQSEILNKIYADNNYENITIVYGENEIEPNLDVSAFKKVTDLFKERLLTGKITRAYLRVLANETEPEMIINERNYLKDVKFEELRYVPDEGIIGGTVAKRVTGNFNNVDENFSIQDREFELYMGVDLDDDALNTPSGINVYNKNAKTTNAYIDTSGKLISLDNALYTVQEIEPKFKKYIMSYTSLKGAGNVRMSYYNENKFISREYSAVSGKIFTVPDNCTRIDIRVDCSSNIYFTDLMITGGETIPEEYEEFIPNIDYIKLGTYIVKKPENNTIADNTSFEALDYMFKLNLPWDNEITFPCTIKALFDNLVAQSGLKTYLTSFPNQDFVVEANPFDDGVTRREVLSAISQMAFNWARLDQEDILTMDFEQTDEIQEVFDIDKYSNLDTQDVYGPVNVIVLRNSQVEGENVTIRDEESISKYGETELVIADNPFAFTEAKRAELIEAGRRLFGLTYTPMTMDMIGYLFLNCQDKIKAQALSGKEYETYLFNHTIEYNGTISDSMESPAKTKTVTKYQFTPDLIKQMRRTEIIVDKANENITLISENLSATNDKVAQLRIDKDRIEAEVNNINKEIKDANGNIVALTSTTEKLTETIEGLTNTLTNTGGINLIRNSVGVFDSEYWEGVVKHYTDTEIKNNTTSGHSILLQNGTITQIVNLKNGFYNISFVYKKLKELAECKIKINDFGILLEELELTNYEKVIEVTNNAVKIEIISDTDDSCYVSDLLLISGTSKQEWTQNINETVSDTVKIGKGIEITSTTSRTKLIADSESVRINNTTNNETVAEFTSTGTTTKNLVVEETAQIAGLLIKKNGNQTWISSLL